MVVVVFVAFCRFAAALFQLSSDENASTGCLFGLVATDDVTLSSVVVLSVLVVVVVVVLDVAIDMSVLEGLAIVVVKFGTISAATDIVCILSDSIVVTGATGIGVGIEIDGTSFHIGCSSPLEPLDCRFI